MAFLSVSELFDMIIMTVFVGFIFSDVFGSVSSLITRRQHVVDLEGNPIPTIGGGFGGRRWNWDNFKFATLVTAPGILLHELGHKIVAMFFGMSATFNAAYGWLTIGLVLKLIGFPFIFFVPAYVSIVGNTTPLNYSLIAFAGPGINMILWLGSLVALKVRKWDKRTTAILSLTKQINMFLFIFNMLPISGFDGAKVFHALF